MVQGTAFWPPIWPRLNPFDLVFDGLDLYISLSRSKMTIFEMIIHANQSKSLLLGTQIHSQIFKKSDW